jgi:hypothetical protein
MNIVTPLRQVGLGAVSVQGLNKAQ